MEREPIVSSHSSPSVVSFDEFSEDEFEADVLVLKSMLKLGSLDGIDRFGRLDELVIAHCPRIISLAPLFRLGSIKRLTIDRCRRFESPPVDWPATLESLLIKDTPIRELGTLPPTILGVLDVHACQSLVSVGDLSRCSSLTDLVIGPSVRDLHGLQGLKNVTVHLDLSTADRGYLPTDRIVPDGLINALSCVDDLSLRIYDPTAYKAVTIANPDCLSRLNKLKKLDLSACEITDPSPLLSLINLEALKVQPRSSLSKALGGCTFSTPTHVRKAKLSILAIRPAAS